ncbi:MAG: response regulator [Magnetococcales bacterium]|nr:response regulator [Magnetococcales bacterium]MBF0630753.1 response regulator [Magnetococcales bacterium]
MVSLAWPRTISQRIIAGFIMVVSLMGLVTWSGLELLDRTRQTLELVVTVDAHNLRLATSMVQDLIALQRAEKNLILARNQAEMDQYEQVMVTIDTDLRQHLATLVTLVGAEDRKKLDQFRSVFESYSLVQQEIVRLTRENSNVEARNLSQGAGQEIFTQLALGIETLVDRSELRVRQTSTILAHSAMAKAHIASQLLDDLLEIQKNERILLFEVGKKESEQLIQQITLSRQRVLETTAKLESLASHTEEELLSRFRERWLEYFDTSERMIHHLREGESIKAREVYKKKGRAQHEIALRIFRQLIQQTDMDVLKARQEMESAIEKAHLGNRINRDLVKIHRAEKDLILTQEIRRMDEYVARIVLLQSNVTDQLERLSRLTAPEEMPTLATLKEQFDKFVQITMLVVERARENANHRAFDLSTGKGGQLMDHAEHILLDLVNRKEKDMQSALRQAEDTYTASRWAGVGISLSAIILCALIARWIIRTLSNRVRFLVRHADAIALGRMALDPPPRTQDELTVIGDALNAISERYLAIADIANHVVEGDFSNRLQLRSSQDQMSRAINEIIENMETIISQAHAIAQGRFDIEITPRSPHDRLRHALKTMAFNLQQADLEHRLRRWKQDGLLDLAEAMRGRHSIEDLSNQVTQSLCRHLNAVSGVMYLVVSRARGEGLQCTGSHAAPEGIDKNRVLDLGEGFIGAAANNKGATLWRDLSRFHWSIATGIGTVQPEALLLAPFHNDGRIRGVIALAFLEPPAERVVQFFEEIMDSIAMAFETAQARPLADALNASRTMAAELQQTNARLRQQSMDLEQARTILEQRNQSLVEAQETLEKQAEKLKQSDQYKSAFLATMSHELRSPMNGLLGMAQLLEKTSLTPGQRDQVTTIVRSGHSLLLMIDDILDLSKIEAGMITLQRRNFELVPVFRSIHDLMTVRAAEKLIDLRMEIHPGVPRYLIGDSGRLHQVVLNLVGNAIKFTEKGSVHLQARVEAGEGGHDWLRMEIRDTGIGIGAEVRAHLFRPFSQGGEHISRRYGGTGLGLAICKSLLTAMGGDIGMESIAGTGSLFWIRIPLEVGNDPPGVVDGLAAKPALMQPIHVLLVEDEPANQQVALGMLEYLGVRTTLAHCGREALEQLQSNRFDLILMDVRLPDIDGLEVTRIVRHSSNGDIASVPIVALTSCAMKSEVDRCHQAGMDGFLAKPVLLEQLEELLHALAGKKSLALIPSEMQPEMKSDNHSLLDTAPLEKMRGDLSRDRFGRVFASCRLSVEQATATLSQTLEAGDHARMIPLAHKLKGMAGTMGLVRLYHLAGQLEHQGVDETQDWSAMAADLRRLLHDSIHALELYARENGVVDGGRGYPDS